MMLPAEGIAGRARRPAQGRRPGPAPLMSTPSYVSPQEFGELCGLSIATVRRYIRFGKLPCVQPAGLRGRILTPRDVLAPEAGATADQPVLYRTRIIPASSGLSSVVSA